MVDDPEGIVREAAIEAIVKIAPEGEYEWLEMALKRISDKDAGVKRAVCHACVSLLDATDLPFCSVVCDSLISLLQDPSVEVCPCPRNAWGSGFGGRDLGLRIGGGGFWLLLRIGGGACDA